MNQNIEWIREFNLGRVRWWHFVLPVSFLIFVAGLAIYGALHLFGAV